MTTTPGSCLSNCCPPLPRPLLLKQQQVVRWQPRVLSMSNSSMKLKAIALATVLGVPPSAIHDILAKQPLLLNLSARTLVTKTRALKELLGFSDLQLWQLVITKPGVLLFASDKLSNKWSSLQRMAGALLRSCWC